MRCVMSVFEMRRRNTNLRGLKHPILYCDFGQIYTLPSFTYDNNQGGCGNQ